MTQVEVTYCHKTQVATCNKSSISPLQRQKPKVYSPFQVLLGKPAFCSGVIKRNKPTKERKLETRNILFHRWQSFHGRLKRKTTWSRVVAALCRSFVVRLHWSTEKHAPICHAGIFLHVMNSLIVYLLFFYTFGVKCLHTILAKKRVFLRLILIFEISHPHTLTHKKFSHTIHWSVNQRTEFQGQIQDFLGGGALVSCSTSTPINHIVFFCLQNTSCVRKPQVISGLGGGGCAPPAPTP